MMKPLYFLLISCILLLLTGCTKENPVMPESQKTQKTWIMFPDADGASIENTLFSSSRINGMQGGELFLQGSTSYANRVITYDSRLQIPADAFSGAKIITEETGTGAFADFGPPMTFSMPLILDLTISGLDLAGLDPSEINFYYMAPDGSLELTQNDGIYIDIDTGTLKVFRARLNHFSRYGWAK